MDIIQCVYFVIYIIYILWIISYFDETYSYDNNTIVYTFVLLLILAVMLYMFWTADPKNQNLTTRLTVTKSIIAILLVCIIGYLIYMWIHQYYLKSRIAEHLRLEPPIMLNLNNQENIRELMQVANLSIDVIKTRVNSLLDINLRASPDVFFNLWWYLAHIHDNIMPVLNYEEKELIISLSDDQLLQLLGPEYPGCRDRASLLFAILCGFYLPRRFETQNTRYEEVSKYSPHIVYNLTMNQNHEYPPYIQLAHQQISPIETLIQNVNADNILDIVNKFGIRPDNYLQTLPLDQQITYIQRDLSSYAKVFSRKADIQPLDLTQTTLSRMEIRDELLQYTNNELVALYEPRVWWNNRDALIDNIIADVTTNLWSWTHGYCTNDETMNIVTLDAHGDTDKSSVINPTLSYGCHKNYQCYQMDELIESFRHHDGCFMFADPDWTPNSNKNRDFPIPSIKQLLKLLKSAPANYNVEPLITKIKYGLKCVKSGGHILRSIVTKFNKFTMEQQENALLYVVWLFCFAMWMRFWAGPGNPWPVKNLVGAYNRGHISARRKQHVIIQSFVRTRLLTMIETDLELQQWVAELPVIYYDFDTKSCTYTTKVIADTLDDVIFREVCMGFSADVILKTAYKLLLDLVPNNKINTVINDYIPRLSEIELDVVENMLNHASLRNSDRQVINQRRINLTIPQQPQPPFDPNGYRNNVHIE